MTISNVEKYTLVDMGGTVAIGDRRITTPKEAMDELNTLSQRVAELEKQLSDERQASVRLRSDYDNMTKQCIKAEAERDELRKQLADLRGDRDTLAARLAADHRFSEAPCPICDYNGPGYFQPSTHPCAAMFHAAMDKRNHEANQNELDAAASGALTRAGKDRT